MYSQIVLFFYNRFFSVAFLALYIQIQSILFTLINREITDSMIQTSNFIKYEK